MWRTKKPSYSSLNIADIPIVSRKGTPGLAFRFLRWPKRGNSCGAQWFLTKRWVVKRSLRSYLLTGNQSEKVKAIPLCSFVLVVLSGIAARCCSILGFRPDNKYQKDSRQPLFSCPVVVRIGALDAYKSGSFSSMRPTITTSVHLKHKPSLQPQLQEQISHK